jgi:predicted enzyme related to lactoylglutathione lyase
MVLWQAGSALDPQLPTSHDLPGIGTRWVLEVDDCKKTFAELKARGVKFVDAQPREDWLGFVADMLDPDGNHFTIHETRKASATTDWAKTGKKA